MKTSILIMLVLIIFSFEKTFATHNRSGQITYKHLYGLTYEATIETYTFTGTTADRCDLMLYWGDGTSEALLRTNGPAGGDCEHFGELLDANTKKNIYVGQHTYAASSTYIIYMEDPNRNGGIINIPNSVNVPFYIESLINVWDPKYCYVNSVNFFSTITYIKSLNDNSFKFNLTAYDPDQDSISYELVPCKGEGGFDIPGYYIPSGVSLNAYTGEFVWNEQPTSIGEYCFAAKISKWRHGYSVGYVIKDFMVTVLPFSSFIYSFSGANILQVDSHGNYYTTLNPNDSLDLTLTFQDNNPLHQTAIHAFSELFLLDNYATYFSDSVMNISNGHLQWVPNVVNGRTRPYLLTFRGYSSYNSTVLLNDLSLFVYVNGNNDPICETPPFAINEKNNYSQYINYYPNPAKNIITIENKTIIPQNYLVTIKNMQGQEVFCEKIYLSTTYSIDVSSFNNGIFIITLQNDKVNYSNKIVIQK